MKDDYHSHYGLKPHEAAELHEESFSVCPKCGAHVSKRRKYCPECGAVVRAVKEPADAAPSAAQENTNLDTLTERPDKSKYRVIEVGAQDRDVRTEQAIQPKEPKEPSATDEPKEPSVPKGTGERDEPKEQTETDAREPLPQPTQGAQFCKKCGKEIMPGSKFCPHCGAAVAAFCPHCGAIVNPVDKFCRRCGTSLVPGAERQEFDMFGDPVPMQEQGQYAQPVQPVAAVPVLSEKDARDIKNRKKGFLIMLITTAVCIIGLYFFVLSSFLSISNGTSSMSLEGIGALYAMFGKPTDLIYAGVDLGVIRAAGWMVFITLSAILLGISFVIIAAAGFKKARVAPYFIPAAIALGASIVYLVLGIVGRCQAADYMSSVIDTEYKFSSYIGGIGCVVFSMLWFVGSLFAWYVQKNAYASFPRKSSTALGALILTGMIGVADLFMGLFPLLIPNPHDVEEVGIGESGYTDMAIDFEYAPQVYIGYKCFLLDDLEYGERYAFSVRISAYVDKDDMADCMALCYYDDVADMSPTQIAYLRPIVTNQVVSDSQATLRFTNTYADYDEPEHDRLAVIVRFSSMTNVKIGLVYQFAEEEE